MNSMKYVVGIILCCLLSQTAFSQKNWLEEADNSFSKNTYYQAVDLYKKAFAKVSKAEQKAHCLFQIAECHRHMTNSEQAVLWYDKAIRARYSDPIAMYHKANMLREQGKYQDASDSFDDFLKAMPSHQSALVLQASCLMAKTWMENPMPYEVSPEYLLNSPNFDFSPTYGKGRGDVLILSSGRAGSIGEEIDNISGENFQDLYTASRDQKGKWSEPVGLGSEINTIDNEGAACLNKKKNLLYFTRCPREKDRNLGCDIWASKKQGSNWGEATPLGFRPENNDSVSIGHPALSSDDAIMVFVSDLPGGQGGKDLWYSLYNKDKREWSEPLNLGPHVNTPGDELFPFIHSDGSLYFASNGHPGMGGLDIFHADMTGFAEWNNPTNMKFPINSSAHDYGIIFEDEEERGYLVSNRSGGRGQDDIYSFRKKVPLFSLVCIVIDGESGDAITNANVELVASDNSIYKSMTDGEGKVLFELKDNSIDRYIQAASDYKIKVGGVNYLARVDGVSTHGYEESTKFIKEFRLINIKPTDSGTGIEMPLVQYPYTECGLLVNEDINSMDSLDYLYKVLVDNPNLVIELMAHTDSRGSSTYNRKLSQCRAQTCVSYLVGRGIDPNRLVAKGYGEDSPLVSEGEIKKLRGSNNLIEQAHQRNRRTEFRVLQEDFGVPNDQ